MRTHVRVLRLLFALSVVLHPGSAAAQGMSELDEGPARLTICNKGTRVVSVAMGAHDLDTMAPTLAVTAWYNIKSGECTAVYDFLQTKMVPLPVYLAFAFISPQGQVTPARMASIPDIGAWTARSLYMSVRFKEGTGLALTRSTRQLCVNGERAGYSVPFNDAVNCGTLRVKGATGALSAVTAQVFFHPSPGRCVTAFGSEQCSGGRYYLDVAPKAGDLELHATRAVGQRDESVAELRTPEQNARDMANATREANAAARAILNGTIPGANGDEPLEFSQKRAKWWTAAPRPASGYQANWTGQILVVRGTVASIGGQAMDAVIKLKETPNLTICPQYPNRLRQIYGADLNVLVGKTIEVTGEVERYGEPCGVTIRIFEVEQFRLAGSR